MVVLGRKPLVLRLVAHSLCFAHTSQAPATPETGRIRPRLWLGRLALLGVVLLGLGFVQLPFRVTVPVHLDLEGRYAITTHTAGSFLVKAVHGAAPAEVAGKPAHLRLVFGSEPLWSHVRFWVAGVSEKFREAQLIELDARFGAAN